MTPISTSTDSDLSEILDSAVSKCRGPSGAIAVLKDGEVIGQRVWGYADLDKRIAMTPDTILPICSISKQMVCQLLVDVRRKLSKDGASPDVVDKQLLKTMHEVMGHDFTETDGLTIQNLCNNQSGLRDYWAMCIPWGAKPENRFTIAEDAPRALERTRSLHFAPGTEFSYCNLNFHVIGEVIEKLTGASLADLLSERIFAPAGMKTARLCADTSRLPGPCVGYEGKEAYGYVPAVNRIEWAGDAGIAASLNDMISYEQYVDRSSSDSQSLYYAIAQPTLYKDGSTATYHNGLFDVDAKGLHTISHGGALRGYRLNRLYAPKERLSVMVMLNHEADPAELGTYVVRKFLKLPESANTDIEPSKDWFGHYLDEDTALSVDMTAREKGRIAVSYAGGPEVIQLTDATHGRSHSMAVRLEDNTLYIDRLLDNRRLVARRLNPDVPHLSETIVGDYKNPEVDSVFHCHGQGDMLYGAFDGFLGKGPIHLMRYIGDDVWLLSCPRSPDAAPPGDWTLIFKRDEQRKVVGVTIGCWLARKLAYIKMG